jgi:hypothetical protein
MEVHNDLEELAFLIGDWEGQGTGKYPTIENFGYHERVSIKVPFGKAFLVYGQQTWRTGAPGSPKHAMHTESGYIRPAGPGFVEFVIAQPTGIVEIHHGTVIGTTLALSATTVATTETATRVRSIDRNITVAGATMVYQVLIGAVGQDHQTHLEASLDRAP